MYTCRSGHGHGPLQTTGHWHWSFSVLHTAVVHTWRSGYGYGPLQTTGHWHWSLSVLHTAVVHTWRSVWLWPTPDNRPLTVIIFCPMYSCRVHLQGEDLGMAKAHSRQQARNLAAADVLFRMYETNPVLRVSSLQNCGITGFSEEGCCADILLLLVLWNKKKQDEKVCFGSYLFFCDWCFTPPYIYSLLTETSCAWGIDKCHNIASTNLFLFQCCTWV